MLSADWPLGESWFLYRVSSGEAAILLILLIDHHCDGHPVFSIYRVCHYYDSPASDSSLQRHDATTTDINFLHQSSTSPATLNSVIFMQITDSCQRCSSHQIAALIILEWKLILHLSILLHLPEQQIGKRPKLQKEGCKYIFLFNFSIKQC